MTMHKTIVDFSSEKSIILVDASYYVFYRYFATLRWFTFKKIEFDIATITENAEFVSSFIRHLEADIKKLCKRWKTTTSNILFCGDCQRCKIWRNDIYKDYKGNRIQNANFNGNIFNIFADHIAKHNLKHIWLDRLEADDVIYLTQLRLKKIGIKTPPLVIITNDNDYLQLTDASLQIINMQFKDITLRGAQNAQANLYYKAIFGDKSDNIPKIATSITKEQALALAKLHQSELKQWLTENELLDKFEFNMHLISFENIPLEYVKKFNDKFLIQVHQPANV